MHPSRHLFSLGSCQLSLLVFIVGGSYLAPLTKAQQSVSPATTRHDSDEFYRSNQVQVIHLRIDDSDLEKMKAALPERIYVPASFRCGDQTMDNVGVRYKGNSSSQPHQQHKRSFLIKFNEFEKGRTFLGLERVALDNGVQFGSLFSEPLITGILHELGIKTHRCNFAKLYLNGRYHGVYVNVERIDSVFENRHFGGGDGALYKVDQGGPGADLSPVPLSFDPRARIGLTFEPKSPAARSDARDVLELITKINQTPAGDFAPVMEQSLDMEAFLQTMAVMLLSGAFDQLTGWNPHNYYLYHDLQDNRWYYLPWDLDVGFADNAFGQIPVISGWNAAWPIPGGPPRPLLERIVDNPQLLARYRRLADEILEKHFHPQVLLPKIDALYEQIKEDLASDPFPHRRITNPGEEDYERIVASIKQFVRHRYATARAQLDNPGARPATVRHSPRPGQGPEPGPPSPDAPSELRVAAQTNSSITLHWKTNATGVVAYIVQRAAGEQGQEFHNYIGKPGEKTETASDTNVAPGQTYRYRVYAVHPTPVGPKGTGVSNTITVRVPDR